MNLSQGEIDLLKQICMEYINTKTLVSKAESVDIRSSANVQINKEFRDALSHILRVFGDQLLMNGEKKATEGVDYYESNLDKAIGHIYRAGYDAIDGVAISIRESLNYTEKFPASIKTHVIPNFAEKIARLDGFHKKITKYKDDKDIGKSSALTFSECIKELDLIREDAQEIEKAMPLMHEILLEKMNENKSQFRSNIIVTIVFSIIFLIVGWFLNEISPFKILPISKNIQKNVQPHSTNQNTNLYQVNNQISQNN